MGRVGVWVSSRVWPADGAAAADAAAELEELGYQALWLGGTPPGTLEQPEAVLSVTSAMAVATGIASVWATPAATMAASYHRVAGAHPDRFLLGLGASHAPLVASLGQEYDKPLAKTSRFLDELDAARPPVPAEGRVLAALGPRMLMLAAERTAGAHPYLVPPEHTSLARETMGPGPLLAPEQKAVLETDPGRARDVGRPMVAMYLRMPNYASNLLRLGFTPDDLSQVSDRLVDALVVWGDEEAIARRVADHRDAGADHVCVQVLTGDQELPRAQWRALAPALLAS